MRRFIQHRLLRSAFPVLCALIVLLGVTVCRGQNLVPQEAEPAAPDAAASQEQAGTVDHARRTREWEQVQEYMGEEAYYIRTLSAWWHKPENRTKTWEEGMKAVGVQKPDADKAYAAALDVMTSDPTDDLGFMAIQFCMKFTEKSEPLYKCTDQALTYLDRYYTNDPRIEDILLTLARAAGKRGEAIDDKVIEKSTNRKLRAEAAYWLVEEKHNEVDDATLPETERSAVREKLLRLAHLLENEYGDVVVWGEKPAKEQMKSLLFSLEHLSLGNVIPDMTAQRVDGTSDDLKNYRGKVVLLDYWATWCIPCVHSLREHVAPLQKELAGKPFTVITLSIDDNPAKVSEFTKNVMPLPFVNWFIGMDSPYYYPWGLAGVPHYYLIDKNGVIRANTFEAETLVDIARKLSQE